MTFKPVAFFWTGIICNSRRGSQCICDRQEPGSRRRCCHGRIIENSEGLAKALEKLGVYSKRLPMDANPSTAHMFIVNPLSGKSLMSLFSTHPPLAERVARLRGSRPSAGGKIESGKNTQEARARAAWDRLSD